MPRLKPASRRRKAAIVAGATVKGAAGTAVGKIESGRRRQSHDRAPVDGKKIAASAGTALRGNPDGTVTIGYTAEQLDALVSRTPRQPRSTGK